MNLGATPDISKAKNAYDGKVFFNGSMHSKILVARAYEERLKLNANRKILSVLTRFLSVHEETMRIDLTFLTETNNSSA
jgi:hypothetical protein